MRRKKDALLGAELGHEFQINVLYLHQIIPGFVKALLGTSDE